MNTTFDEPPDKPKKNAFQQIQEQIEHQMRPFRQIEEMQNLVKRHSSDYQLKEFARQFEPHRKIREMVERSSSPKHIQDIIDESSIFTQAKRMMEQYIPANAIAGIGIHKDAIRQVAEMSESIRRAAGLDFANDLTRKFTESNSAFRAIEEAQKSLNRLLPTFRDINLEQFEASEEDNQETNQVVESINRAATEQESIQQVVDLIVSAIQTQNKPTVRLMLWRFFCKILELLLAGIIATSMTHYAPAVLGESPQAAKKAIQESARAAIGSAEIRSEYRYVSVTTLIVRQNPKARSPEVGRLSFSKLVKLLKKENDFALVIWTDQESGAEIQGWVFSRYLGKLN